MKKFILVFVLYICFAVPIRAEVIYVDKNMNDGFWSGSYTDLQEAIQTANSGDEIWVAVGTYHPGADRSDSFVLKPGVKIYGGFYGGEVSREDRDTYKNATVLSGDIGLSGDPSDNSYHVITYNGILDQQTLIDGFTIRDGNADNGEGGGGMYLINGAEPLIRNCRFSNNQSTTGGGAVFLKNGPRFVQCLFESNDASKGGAIYSPEDRIQTGDAQITRSTFVQNTAISGSALFFDKRESVYVDSCVFWQNTNASGSLNTFSLDHRARSASVLTNTASDDNNINGTVSGLIHYRSTEKNGPFRDTENYLLDNQHGIPEDYGWYYVPSPLVLNIKLFLEGAF